MFVSCTDARPEPFPAPPSHFLPSAASSPSHLPAGHREKFRRWGGALEENRGLHLTAFLLTDGSQVCIVYRRSTRAIPCAALAFPSLRRFLTLASACWPQGKIPPQPPGPSPKTKRTNRNAARKDSKSS